MVIEVSHSAAEPLPFPTGGGKSFLLGGSDDVLESVLGLGDLADLTVTNDETDYGYDVRGKNLQLHFKTQTFFRKCFSIIIYSSSDAVQQGVFLQEDLELQVHATEPLRRCPSSGLPPR